jgi:hypothetical protein
VGAAVVTALGLVLAACSTAAPQTSQVSTPSPSVLPDSSPNTTEVVPSPVVFAFRCRVRGAGSKTFTTYAAVWRADATDCDAIRITGSKPSEQQQSAVQAAKGTETLERLAALCAVTDGGPWSASVDDARSAAVARALLVYCPGHPESSRLRAAIAAYRG